MFTLLAQVNISVCSFLVDLDTGSETEREPNYSAQEDKWAIIKSIPFLDTSKYVLYLNKICCNEFIFITE